VYRLTAGAPVSVPVANLEASTQTLSSLVWCDTVAQLTSHAHQRGGMSIFQKQGAGRDLASRFATAAPPAAAPRVVAAGACRPVSSYQKMYRIGEGTYGTVYRARDKHSGEVVALKKVILHNEKSDGFPITSVREINLLKRLSAARARDGGHPNIVELLEIVVGKQREGVFLVFEYCEHDLAALIDNMPRKFSESEVRAWGRVGCASCDSSRVETALVLALLRCLRRVQQPPPPVSSPHTCGAP
jgi:hypothetical protein